MGNQLITLLTGPGGLLVALLVIIYTGVKRKWVFGWYAAELRSDRDEWKEAALRATTIGERVVSVHEQEKEDAANS